MKLGESLVPALGESSGPMGVSYLSPQKILELFLAHHLIQSLQLFLNVSVAKANLWKLNWKRIENIMTPLFY